jgi:hypothetical protein
MQSKFFAAVSGLMAVGVMLVFALPAAFAQEALNGVEIGNGCQPCIVVKGCPAPCAVEKIVTVCKPCPCPCTVQVTILVPPGECERVRVERDGDARYHYGRYGVHLDWRDRGNKLVVRYHG